jgi:ATP-dependent RNA helicase RhlE
MGYLVPTPIQVRTIPLVMHGRDVIGSAQTGTGKTAAFALPILSLLDHHQPATRCLVLEPTRELAAQVETAIHDFARFTNLHTAVLYGGVGYGKQLDALKAGADIIVATPGRLLDHMERGTCRQILGYGRGGSDAGHGISSGRAAHRSQNSARAPHLAFLGDDPP